MSTWAVVLSLAVLISGAAAAWNLRALAEDRHARVHMLERQVLQLTEENARVKGLPQSPVPGLADNYAAVYAAVQELSAVYGLHVATDLLGASGEADNAPVRPSPWPGIQQLSMIIHVRAIKAMDEYMRILGAVAALEDKYVLSVRSIAHSGGALDVTLDVYGVPQMRGGEG